jgi:hypothetical protein
MIKIISKLLNKIKINKIKKLIFQFFLEIKNRYLIINKIVNSFNETNMLIYLSSFFSFINLKEIK